MVEIASSRKTEKHAPTRKRHINEHDVFGTLAPGRVAGVLEHIVEHAPQNKEHIIDNDVFGTLVSERKDSNEQDRVGEFLNSLSRELALEGHNGGLQNVQVQMKSMAV